MWAMCLRSPRFGRSPSGRRLPARAPMYGGALDTGRRAHAACWGRHGVSTPPPGSRQATSLMSGTATNCTGFCIVSPTHPQGPVRSSLVPLVAPRGSSQLLPGAVATLLPAHLRDSRASSRGRERGIMGPACRFEPSSGLVELPAGGSSIFLSACAPAGLASFPSWRLCCQRTCGTRELQASGASGTLWPGMSFCASSGGQQHSSVVVLR